MKDIYIEIPDNFAVEEAGELREKIYDLINKGERDFLCDFSRCRFIDSTGLGVLVSVYKKCMEINGSLKLKDINSEVLRVFQLTRLDTIFTII